MAYDKIITVRTRLDHCLNYILNPEKSGGLRTSINCELALAYADMQATKTRWSKTGGVLGYHLIHSFAPGEVTPEQAYEIGVEFAQRLLGERYETVIATHRDRGHLHCHILFNSVSFVDGKKYQNTFKDYFGDIRKISNDISQSHGLSVIESQNGGRHYAEWSAEKKGKPTLRDLVRQDIDAALAKSFTYKSFWEALTAMGYEIKRGAKHPALKPPGGKRFLRLDSLGGGYGESALMERLEKSRVKQVKIYVPPPRCKARRAYKFHSRLHGFRALYYRYLYLLRGPNPRKKPRPYAVRKEVVKLNRYARQFRLLREYGIDSDAQLAMLGDALQAQIDALVDERKALYKQKRKGCSVDADIQNITNGLRPLRQKLKLCAQIEEEIPRIRGQITECVPLAKQEREVPENGRKRRSR